MLNALQTVPFFFGEDKRLTFQITAKDGRPFSILAATWILKDRYENEVLTGSGQIDDMNGTITVQLKPPQKGGFILEVQYLIGLETLIERVKLEVC